MSPNRLGVDLGTTWTAAAIVDRQGVRALTLGDAGPAMPSVVAFDDGVALTGDAAERRLLADPSSGVREPKRRLGDTTPFVIGGTPYGADALMGHLLAQVVATATEQLGEAPASVVLTHPANWGEYKLDLLREAARIADVPDVALVSEPEAAARHYVELGRLQPGDAVAVYDFGGGTFDVAVVRCTASGTEVLGTPEGLERLGGIDLDQAVLAHVNAALDGKLGELDSTDAAVRKGIEQLRHDCTRAKEALSVDSDTSIAVRLPDLVTEIRITRDEFESAIRGRLTDTLTSLDRALESAGLTTDELAGVLLVGGSSRIPLVAELVGQHTGRPVLVDADAKLVVALGAAGGRTSEPAAAAASAPPAQETTMSDQQTSDASGGEERPAAKRAVASAAGGASGKGTDKRASGAAGEDAPADKKKKERKGGVTPGGVAAGVAGVAAAAGVVGGGIAAADALTGDDGDGDGTTDDAAAPPADESMDAFDDVAGSAGGAGGAGGAMRAGGIGGGGGGGGSATRARARAVRADDDGPAAPAGRGGGAPTSAPMAEPTGAEAERLAMVRAQLQERLDTWTPPEGTDPAEAAELKAELASMLDRFRIEPGQSVDDAIAELRADFDDRVKDFVQDQKIEALIEEQQRERAEAEALVKGVDEAKATLEQRLADWQPPEGTDPAAASELRAELGQLLENFVPVPGSTVEQAIADLRQRFDNEVKDFAQDQKIDALVGLESDTSTTGTDTTTSTGDMTTGDTTTGDTTTGDTATTSDTTTSTGDMTTGDTTTADTATTGDTPTDGMATDGMATDGMEPATDTMTGPTNTGIVPPHLIGETATAETAAPGAEEPTTMTGPPPGFEGRPAPALADVFDEVEAPVASTGGQPSGTGLDGEGRGEAAGIVAENYGTGDGTPGTLEPPPGMETHDLEVDPNSDILGGDLVMAAEEPVMVTDGGAMGDDLDAADPLDPRLTTTLDDLVGDESPLEATVLEPDPLTDQHFAVDAPDDLAPPDAEVMPEPEPEPEPDPVDDQPDEPTIV